MQQNRLAAGLRPDPLGELTALPQTPSWFQGPLRGGKGRRFVKFILNEYEPSNKSFKKNKKNSLLAVIGFEHKLF
jgi:hypothetical protein